MIKSRVKKEAKKSSRDLTKENKKIIMKIEHYLETRYINQIVSEEILSDMIGMALECQERGDSFSSMIGDDHQSFCRELVKNSPKKFIHERVLGILHWFLLFAMLLCPGLFLLELLFPSFFPGSASGLTYIVNTTYIVKYYILTLVLVLGWFFVRMNSYKPTKYLLGIWFIVFMLVFLFIDLALGRVIKDWTVNISLIVWVLTFGTALLICDLSLRITAMTIAYKRNNRQ